MSEEWSRLLGIQTGLDGALPGMCTYFLLGEGVPPIIFSRGEGLLNQSVNSGLFSTCTNSWIDFFLHRKLVHYPAYLLVACMYVLCEEK